MPVQTTPPPVAAVGRADRVRNDDLILRVAAELLLRTPGVSMRAIADAAGLTRPTVYRRYPDREALLAGLRVAVDAELEQSLDGIPDWSEGADVMAELIRALVTVASRYPVARLRYAPGATEAPPADARVTAILRAGQQHGRLRDDVDARTLNTAVFGLLSAVLDTPSLSTTVAADTILTLLMSGIRQQPTPDPIGH